MTENSTVMRIPSAVMETWMPTESEKWGPRSLTPAEFRAEVVDRLAKLAEKYRGYVPELASLCSDRESGTFPLRRRHSIAKALRMMEIEADYLALFIQGARSGMHPDAEKYKAVEREKYRKGKRPPKRGH